MEPRRFDRGPRPAPGRLRQPHGASHAAITDDSNLTDDRLEARAFLEAPVPFAEAVRLGVAGDLTHRTGTWSAHDLSDTRDDLRVGVTVTTSL
jgi:hypothetical protein